MKIKSICIQIINFLVALVVIFGIFLVLLSVKQTNLFYNSGVVFADEEITHSISERIDSWNVVFVDSEVNGLRYELLDDNQKTVSVFTCSASGEVIIPHKINYNN